MKKVYYPLIILIVPLALLLSSYHTGSPGGKTGSPGDNGNTCTQCHTGTANSFIGWISSDIPVSGYIPGQTYTITATGTYQGVVRFGFELTTENSSSNKVGTFVITDPTRTKLVNGNHAVTHTANGIQPTGNSCSWSMNWIAPPVGTGTVGIYAAFNAANGNGNTTGDVIFKGYVLANEAIASIASITPDQAGQGESFTDTIMGLNTQWSGNPMVSLSLHNNPSEVISATNVYVINETLLHADFTIPQYASLGNWDVHVDDIALLNGFEVLLQTGLSENSNISEIKIYPNPTRGIVYLDNTEGFATSVRNIDGQLLFSKSGEKGLTSIDLSSFSEGIYFVELNDGKRTWVKKILLKKY